MVVTKETAEYVIAVYSDKVVLVQLSEKLGEGEYLQSRICLLTAL